MTIDLRLKLADKANAVVESYLCQGVLTELKALGVKAGLAKVRYLDSPIAQMDQAMYVEAHYDHQKLLGALEVEWEKFQNLLGAGFHHIYLIHTIYVFRKSQHTPNL